MSIFLIASVSATDLNTTDEVISLDDNIDEVSVNEESEVLSVNYTPTSFSEIQTAVDSAQDGDTIVLKGYYKFSATINVDKQLTFVGINDATVDGDSSLRLFSVSNDSVFFKNIIFKNGKAYSGAAIEGKCTALNCTFINNHAAGSGGVSYNPSAGSIVSHPGDGGAIKYGTAVNCTFINNVAGTKGGAISEGNAYNCTFINNTVLGENNIYVYGGGAIYNGDAYNCIFKNNSAIAGGAIFDVNAFNSIFIGNTAQFKYANNAYSPGVDTTNIYSGGAMCGGRAENSTFINNSAPYGGAVCKANLKYCTLINNSAEYGGGLYYYYSTEITDCAFENNIASHEGNEICIASPSYRVSIFNCNFTNAHSNKNSWFIFFNSTESLSMDGCNFINCSSDGNGGAIYLNNGPATKISNCNFEGNSAGNGGSIYYYRTSFSISGCYFKNNVADNGGAIFYERDGTVINCSFENNKANIEGNEIYFKESKDINLLNCSFIGCLSEDDKWYIAFKNANSLTMVNCNFINCSSNEKGGAINLRNGLTYNLVSCCFEGNTAEYGGAIYSDGISFSLENCTFVKNIANKGGALSLENLLTYKLTGCIFDSNNVATGDGGAIHCLDSSLNIDNCTFTCNNGKNGGALFLDNVLVSNVSDCIFRENKGAYGAAIHSAYSALFIDNCSFIGNYAFMSIKEGFAYRVTGVGGAIYNSESEINVDHSVFKENNGYIQAGSIYGDSTVSNSIFEHNQAMMTTGGMEGGVAINCTFINNYGNSGGAMKNGRAVNCTFIDNRASSKGGAADNVVAVNCSFIGNDVYNTGSGCNGGAMNGGSATNCNFVNNSAGYGGAISNCENILNSTFVGNVAVNDGGAVYFDNIANAEVIGCSFINCSSKKQAGAIYCSEKTNLNIQSSLFKNCSSNVGNNSLVIVGENLNANITDCLFDVIPENITSKFNSILTVSDLNIVLGEECILIANLSDVRGQLVNKTVIFTVNGNDYIRYTNSEGLATFNIKDYIHEAGNHVIHVAFSGDDNEFSSSAISNVDIMNYRAKLLVNTEGKYYDDTNLIVKLINLKDSSPISNASINVRFEDGSSVCLKSDKDGSASYKVPFSPGSYVVTASVADNFVDVKNATTSFIINAITGKIAISQVNNTILGVRVFNPNNGDEYNNIKVSLKFNDMDPIYVVTNKNGVATYNMDFEPGSYSVLAVISKDFTDINAVLENIEIKSEEVFYSKISLSDIVFDYGGTGYCTYTIVDGSISKSKISVDGQNAKIDLIGDKIVVSGLPAGSYTLRVETIPSENYQAVNGTANIIVNKIDSNVIFSKQSISFDYGSSDSTTVKVEGGSLVKDNIHILDNTNNVISFNDGVINISGLNAGNYKLQVTTTPDENHNQFTKTIDVIVNKVNSEITVGDNIVFDYGGSGSVDVNVFGGSIPLGGISVINHPEAVISFKNNNIAVSNLSAGNYTLRISVSGDSNHKSTSKNIQIIVNKVDSVLSFDSDNVNYNYGDLGIIGISVVGGEVVLGKINVLNHSEAVIRINNNVISVSGLNAGNYTLQVTTNPDNNHNAVTRRMHISVAKIDSYLGFSAPIVLDYGGQGSTAVSVVGGKVLPENMHILNHPEAKIDINKNMITVSNLTVGRYTLNVTSTPDLNHNAVSEVLDVIVNKIDSSINFNSEISFKYGKSGSIGFVVDGCSINLDDVVVIGHPEAKLDVDSNFVSVSGLAVGKYTLLVTTSPDEVHNSVNATVSITVTKQTGKITVKTGTVAYKKSTNWAITLKDGDDNPVSGIKVNLKIYKGNKLYKNVDNLKVTDANGVTNYNTKGLPVGTYKFVVSVSHVGYNVKSVSTPVKVIKQTAVKIIINTKADKKGAVISIIVKDKAGKKYLNNIKLKLSIKNGKTYTNIDLISGNYKSGKGVCAYSTNMLTVGSHAVKVVTTDIKYSGSASKSVKVLASSKKYRNWWEKISKGKKTSYGT